MNQESEVFERLLLNEQEYFNAYRYSFNEKKLFNENSQNEFTIFRFKNSKLNKYLVFTFYPSAGRIIKNEFTVGFTKSDEFNRSFSLDVPAFLAYKELKRTIHYEDAEKYRFKVKSSQLELSIKEQLQLVKNILSTDLHSILTTNEWIDIPHHDPRDDY